MPSPLVQGGLEIPIKVSVTWDEPEKLSVLVVKVKEVDDLKNILQELGVEEDEDNDDDVGFSNETVDNEDIQML